MISAPSPPTISRRAVLGAAALWPLAACTTQSRPTAPSSPVPATAAAASPAASASAAVGDHEQLVRLERKFDARLGVYALATGTGVTIAHRADERFAFCSTFKALAAAAVLRRNPLSYLNKRVTFTQDALMPSSLVTEHKLATGMTIGEVCDAAVRYSDGTAGNLLLRELGGPAQLTAYLRTLDDTVTRADRWEPKLTEAAPGDPRDTTTPRAIGSDYHRIVAGDALPPDKRAYLRDLLQRANVRAAGKQRIRAGVPAGWTVADKTGTGAYGTINDIAVVWPAKSAPPLVIAVMSRKGSKAATADDALIAEAARYVVATLT